MKWLSSIQSRQSGLIHIVDANVTIFLILSALIGVVLISKPGQVRQNLANSK